VEKMNSMTKMKENIQEAKAFTIMDYLKFIIPSLIGMILFITPINTEDGITVPIAFLSNQIHGVIGKWIPTMVLVIMGLSVVGSLVATILKPKFILENKMLNTLFNISKFWVIARLLGTIFAAMALYKIGPEMIHSENTGGLLLYDLIPILFTTFFLAGILLPLLLNFGLLEFVGSLFMKLMRPIFTLPGRSSLDCLASWVGDGTIGVLLTSKQYEEGYYTKREAAVIATTFSVVSITFSIVILQYLDLEAYFVPYYATILIAGLVAAVIMPRIRPLSKKPDTGYEKTELKAEDMIPEGVSQIQWGLNNAVVKAKKNDRIGNIFKEGFQNVLDMWLGVLPIVMAIGTVALVIAEFTPFFTIMGKPFEPILTLMQVPEAAEAAQTMVIGFADMLLPAILGSGIESELTRFVIAGVSITQLVYLSEMGGLLLGSKLPVSFKDLVLIFILRTVITLPIVVLAAHIIF
jgi:nucleoside recognition membrane protein YjiH